MLKLSQPITLVKLGLLLTAYLCLSLIVFFLTSNTIIGAIVYFYLLLPLYGVVLLGGWVFIWQHRTQAARVRWWIWIVILALQIGVILSSPGNCYGAKQGDRCYSNLQILAGNASRSGSNDSPHWKLVEDSFPAWVIAYDIALGMGVRRISVVTR